MPSFAIVIDYNYILIRKCVEVEERGAGEDDAARVTGVKTVVFKNNESRETE